MRVLFAILTTLAFWATGVGLAGESPESAPGEIGLRVGAIAPEFELFDQGNELRSLTGSSSKGITALLFFRSADW